MWRCKWCSLTDLWGPDETDGTHEMHEAIHTLAESIFSHGTHENRDEIKKLTEVSEK